MKQQLEDLAFAALYPKRYAELDHLVQLADARARRVSRYPGRSLTCAPVSTSWASTPRSPVAASTSGAIYEKMVVKGREFDEIFDLVAVRVIVDSIRRLLRRARVHPRTGGGRCQAGSRTTSRCPSSTSTRACTRRSSGRRARPIEVQIRTAEMHRRAEWGVAAHWAYKTARAPQRRRRLAQPGSSTGKRRSPTPAQFMQSLKTDLEQDEVFVFTPKGRVVTLPVGSTPVDFAYAVHTEVGHSCIGAKVNGRLVSLDHVPVEWRQRRDLHLQGRDRRPLTGLAGVRRVARGRATRSASGSAGSAGST